MTSKISSEHFLYPILHNIPRSPKAAAQCAVIVAVATTALLGYLYVDACLEEHEIWGAEDDSQLGDDIQFYSACVVAIGLICFSLSAYADAVR